jgi:hypothetical protein
MHNKNGERETPKTLFLRLFRELPNGRGFFKADGSINQKIAGDYLGVDQSVLSRWLKRDDAPPPDRVVEGMVKRFKVTRAQARCEIDIPQQALDLSDTARGVARNYDDLPISAQQFITSQITEMLDFRDKHPRVFDIMFRNVNSESYRMLEAQIEKIQVRLRARDAKNKKNV